MRTVGLRGRRGGGGVDHCGFTYQGFLRGVDMGLFYSRGWSGCYLLGRVCWYKQVVNFSLLSDIFQY